MRPRYLVAALVLGLGLACTVGEPEDEDEAPVAEDPAPEPGRKKKRRRNEQPADGEQPDDGNDGGRGGDGGGGASPEPSPRPSPDPPSETPDPPSGITQVGDTAWTVKRKMVDKWENDPSKFADAREHNKGWELRSIQKYDDAWWLGLRNGDVVKKVNGMPLDTQADLIKAYAALKDKKHFTLDFRRGDGPLKHSYDIVN